MRKIIGTAVGMLLSAIVTAVLGYWNSRGIVAIGDSRIPAWPIGFLGVLSGAVTGLTAASEPVRRAIGRLTASESVTQPLRASSGGISGGGSGFRSAQLSPTSVPDSVRHLNDCLYHLRVVLADDATAQDLLDQISVKVARRTANAAVEHSDLASE